jgi:hypothetical protein
VQAEDSHPLLEFLHFDFQYLQKEFDKF